ncbi:MAG: hypothetical protein ACK5PS_12430 [Desulfopila sp.]
MKRQGSPLLLVDSGNILFGHLGKKRLQAEDLLSATAIGEIYRDLGYDAMAVGPYDLANGVEFLHQLARHGIPWVSANLLTPEGEALLTPWVVRQRGPYRIGILALTAAESGPGYRIAPWQEVLPRHLDTLFSRGADFLVLLSNLDQASNTVIAERYPQINLIVSADPMAGNMVPRIHRNTLFSQSHSLGKYLGILHIKWTEVGLWQETIQQRDPAVTQLLNAYRLAGERPGLTADEAARLRQQEGRLERVETTTSPSGGTFTFTFLPLSAHVADDVLVQRQIEQVRGEIVRQDR